MFNLHFTKFTLLIVGYVFFFIITFVLNRYAWKVINSGRRMTRKYTLQIFLISLFSLAGLLFTISMLHDDDDWHRLFPGWRKFWDNEI